MDSAMLSMHEATHVSERWTAYGDTELQSRVSMPFDH